MATKIEPDNIFLDYIKNFRQCEELELCELREYAQKVFLRDNHTRYHKYCKEWLENLTPNQFEEIKVWKYFEESGNLKK